jgi:hypothetical protein
MIKERSEISRRRRRRFTKARRNPSKISVGDYNPYEGITATRADLF